jgi:hypothetical protein
VPCVGQIDGPSAFQACQFVAQGLGVALVDPSTFSAASRLDIVALPIRPEIKLFAGFFSKLARSVLRHIRVTTKQELKDRIMAAMAEFNRHPVVHTWSYKLDQVA